MTTVVESWLEYEGKAFLEDIGIKRGQSILDFGCGSDHYTIPAAKVVGGAGVVHALDKDGEALDQVAQLRESRGLEDIVRIRYQPEGLEIGLEDEPIDLMLLYDVLHYLNPGERVRVYNNAHRVWKADAILSVYPKHCKSDEPLWNLADLELEDIVKEIEGAGFHLERKLFKKLVHDEGFDNGYILNYGKRAGKAFFRLEVS
ncbi:MAG: class I SAM-dependent methyltransferase [Actinomycetota bacterium]|nr:class I SAM-dependent methyltransferase [Actinomycetota bacterium]